MKYLFYTLIIGCTLIPTFTSAVTGNNVFYDWSLGETALTTDNVSSCDDTAVARYDWSLGETALVYDITANCTASVAAGGEEYIIIFE